MAVWQQIFLQLILLSVLDSTEFSSHSFLLPLLHALFHCPGGTKLLLQQFTSAPALHQRTRLIDTVRLRTLCDPLPCRETLTFHYS